MLFIFISLHFHKCDHGTHPPIVIPTDHSKRSLKLTDDTQWDNIRIEFDYKYLFGDYSCKSATDTVSWGGRTYSCAEGDVADKEQKTEIVKQTLINLKNYLNRLLKVHPSTEVKVPATLSTQPYYQRDQATKTGVDLYIYVYARPYQGSSTLASASPLTYIVEDSRRPDVGMININFAKLGNSASSEKDADRDIFETLLHETCHILGISDTLFKQWDDGQGKRVQSKNIYECSKAGSTFTILSTPKIKEVIKKRFGLSGDYFTDLTLNGENICPIGVEIEDGGGSGTKGSHWDGRVYAGELMTGYTHGFHQFQRFH